MNRLFFVCALCLPGCGNDSYSGPPCSDVDYGEITVDTSGETPVFSWTGAQPSSLVVLPGDAAAATDGVTDAVLWGVDCACREDGDCRDEADWSYRACIDSPTTYGEPGDAENAVESTPPAALPAGTYTLRLGTWCEGGELPEAYGTATFTLP